MNDITMKQKYDSKKQSCVDRRIPFEVTFEEWVQFHKLRDTVDCAYSGRKFSYTKPSDPSKTDDRPTIERIDDNRAYTLSNMVWVTATCNQLANEYILLGKPTKGLSATKIGILQRIKKTLNHKEVYDEMMAPYLSVTCSIVEENLRLANEQKVRNDKLQEVVVAKMYHDLGHMLLVTLEADMDLTFNQYKRTLCREKCQLTNAPLPDDLKERGLFIVDKLLPVTLDNTLVTTKVVADSLDVMMATSGLPLWQLKKMFLTLSK